MVKLISAKCPNCGAILKLSKEEDKVKCEYCKSTIIVDDAIACFKLKVSGNISIDGITTNAELIESANELLNMNEYLKAKRKFSEFSEKCPDNYQGWLGLLICRTRNFSIKDNNIMFENDVNKYYEHFSKTAPEDIKNEYFEIIDRYFAPEKYLKIEEQEKEEKRKQEIEEQKRKRLEEKEKKKSERLKNHTYKKIYDFENKFKIISHKFGNGFLYFIGVTLIISYIISFKEDVTSSIFGILFALSLFKVFYTNIENKFNQIDKIYIKIARFVIPLLLLTIWMACTPIENTENTKNTEKVENNETVGKTTYYIEYNKLGSIGKYMEFEKKNVIFYYLPEDKYKIEATNLNENVCFLWIDYNDGYQNGDYGTAYNTKETLKFTNSSKINTIYIDSSVHIYSPNNCDYKITLIS